MAVNEPNDYRQIISSFEKLKVLVVGDVMVDSYLYGKVERISPEAPVPVVSVTKRDNRLGGAANVALNIKSLGAEPFLCSVVGNDPKGSEFIGLLDNEGISSEGIVRSNNRITTTKFRIIGNRMQMLRVDEEVVSYIGQDDMKRLETAYLRLLEEKKIDVVVFQDYDKGVITEELIRRFVEAARGKDIPVAVDPKKRNFLNYRNVTLFKPNLKELKEGLNIDFDHRHDIAALDKAAQRLMELLKAKIILVTLSDEGIFISHQNKEKVNMKTIPSHVRSVADVSGAGDTVISVASLCLALRLDPSVMALISNMAGGIVCEEAGVVPVNREKLIRELERKKS